MMGNKNFPGLRDAPFHVLKEEFIKPSIPRQCYLYSKSTIINKSFKSNPSIRTKESNEQVHGEHDDSSSCGKCVHEPQVIYSKETC